ncbi:MAG: gamma-glutamyltransferase, partial [Saprospiraceae bacterium]
VIGQFNEYTVITLAPPSSGGIILMQVLGMINTFRLDKIGMNEPKSMTIMAEAEKIAFADRATHFGDPDFYHVPEEALLSPKYLKSRAALINPNLATPSERISSGISAPKQSEQTTHYSIADKKGNVVSVTTSLNNNFGSKVVVGGAGFFLNSTMDDFSVKPGIPNMFGLTGSIANKVEPGKRMLSSMTPTIVLKNYKPFLALGSPGGPMICTTVFQVIANRIIFGKTLEQAVAAPRFHHQWKPDELYIEKDKFSHEVLEALRAAGYKLNERTAIGAVDAIEILPDGSFIGVADPRGNDSAAGY